MAASLPGAMLEYRGYLGSVLYNDEDEVLHGRLEFIRDLVTYEAQDARSLKRAFREAVDDYLGLCEAEKREPDVPLKGSYSTSCPRAKDEDTLDFTMAWIRHHERYDEAGP